MNHNKTVTVNEVEDTNSDRNQIELKHSKQAGVRAKDIT